MGAYHWAECDRTSSRYNPPLEARYRVIAKRVTGAKRALDVGCGDGYLMNLLSPFCQSVFGVDPEPTAVALAAAKLQGFANCMVARASCYQLPFSNGCFDLVLLADVFEHLENPKECLREVSRILAPDGTLVVTTPKWRPDRIWDRFHYKEYKPEELAVCLQSYFSQVTMTFFWPMAWYRIYSTRIGWRLMRIFCRYLANPFLREGSTPEAHHQILAVCQQPRQ